MSMSIYGVLFATPPRRWPTKPPAAFLDYTWDMTSDLTDPATGLVDPPVTVTVQIMPSGTGEIAASRLTVSGTVLTVWLAGGVPGRNYIVDITVLTVAARIYQWDLTLLCDPLLAPMPLLPLPPSLGFGPPLTWSLPP